MYTVFEHEALYLNRGDQKLNPEQLKLLQIFYKERNFPYYKLIHNGVRFCEYVGIIKVGNLTIEVLPKADRTNGAKHWRNILIDMMKSIGLISPDAPSYANLNIKSSSVLDMYFELFISEVEKLKNKGLLKKYRKKEVNSKTLKGKILIGKQITKNYVHQERFYVNQTVYDKQHLLHQILYKALSTIIKVGTTTHLTSRYNNALLDFPEQSDIRIIESLFDKIIYDRKSQDYKTAIDIAKIILLNYHPDLNNGPSNVLALMFNMNALWEKFVLKSLQKFTEGFTISGQVSKNFWKPEIGYTKAIRPDIVLSKNGEVKAVFDTKWKNIGDSNPSDDDLRQLYAYSRYHSNCPSYLIYPNDITIVNNGRYQRAFLNESETPGGIIKLKVFSGKKDGMEILCREILEKIE